MNGSFSLGAELAKVLGFLGLMVFGCALLMKKKSGRALQRHGGRLEVVDSLALGGNRLICLVKFGASHVLVGVTDQNVNLIKEVKEGEVPGVSPEQGETPVDPQDYGQAGQPFTRLLAEEFRKARRRLSGKGPLLLLGIVLLVSSLFWAGPGAEAMAAPAGVPVPDITVNIDGQQASGGLGTSLGILGMLTVLTLAPAILVLTTSFTRIVIVFSFLRSGLGTQQAPPNQVLIGLALMLTFFIMTPTWNAAYETAIAPYIAGEINTATAIERASIPLKEFMLRETRENDLGVFATLGGQEEPESPEQMSIFQVAPAFCISELRTAFEMGFMLYLPFLVVDMVVASTLMSMGMLMLPPVLISLPFKLLLFILVDGWGLITKSLVAGFR
ncbi:MAG: flagellar type III secretion system pore protein FliP [Bacillota bacterium]